MSGSEYVFGDDNTCDSFHTISYLFQIWREGNLKLRAIYDSSSIIRPLILTREIFSKQGQKDECIEHIGKIFNPSATFVMVK